MKKIVIIIPSLNFWWWAEKVASNIWTELSKKWYIVSFFTFYDEWKKYPFLWKYYSLKEKLQNNLFIKIIKLFSRAYKISKFCKNNSIETAISFMEDANFSLILSKFFWNKSKVIVSIRHSLFEYWKWIYFYLIKILYKFSNEIIVLTKFEKENLVSTFWITSSKIDIIYNPINIEKINNLKNEELWEFDKIFNNWMFNFISIWRLNKIKNQKLLIDIFLKFNKKYINSQLIILWDGELKDELRKQIWNNKSIFLLWNKKNVYKYLYNSDCFILTSFSEAFPNVIIEAMSCNLAIISSDTQWGKEIIRNNHYWILFKNNDKNSLFEAMEKIYLNEEMRNAYRKKSIEVSMDFDIKNIIGQWKKIL